MNIVIPKGRKCFYFNRKINCLTENGTVIYGDPTEILYPRTYPGCLIRG
jgi:hypothetical protein